MVNLTVMKKIIYFGIFLLTSSLTHGQGQPPCLNNMLLNSDFSAALTSWSQYGQTPTATVLTASSGCLNTFAALQATSGSSCGIRQAATFKRDSCYSLCYCIEFPGSAFNSRFLVALVNPGVTPTQLLTGAYTPAQAMIVDSIIAIAGITAYTQCATDFQTTTSYAGIVFINQTVGNIGSDVRIDNICLQPAICKSTTNPCDSVNANFSFTVPSGTTANFTDLSTSNPGDVLSWSWDFGDPPSGINNFSALQNPSHTFPTPGAYLVCLYLTAITNNGLVCRDTFCIDLTIPNSSGILSRNGKEAIDFYPNPNSGSFAIGGSASYSEIEIYNLQGQLLAKLPVIGAYVSVPTTIPSGIYTAVLTSENKRIFKKIVINRDE